ncbi:MAG: class IV adenylate cyclase [Candidatus Hodarchaeales archaeon]|jgi:adenylate cyclase class 2
MEAELKIPIADIFIDEDLRGYLTQIIGSPVEEIIQIDTYFQSPVNDFRNTDEALRIRQILSQGENETIELTYKGPKTGKDMKVREEITSRIIHYAEATKILEQLGFSIVMKVSKKRTNWHTQSITLSLDEVKGLDKFIEVETMTINSPQAIENDKNKLIEFTRSIFPDWNGKNERKSYLELLMEKQTDSG